MRFFGTRESLFNLSNLVFAVFALFISTAVLTPIAYAEEYGVKNTVGLKNERLKQKPKLKLNCLVAIWLINSAAEQNFVYSMVQGNTDPSLGTASDGWRSDLRLARW